MTWDALLDEVVVVALGPTPGPLLRGWLVVAGVVCLVVLRARHPDLARRIVPALIAGPLLVVIVCQNRRETADVPTLFIGDSAQLGGPDACGGNADPARTFLFHDGLRDGARRCSACIATRAAPGARARYPEGIACRPSR